MNTQAKGQLMTEEEIKQYFIQNGGIVRNTDIVNYFRPYLSNPAVREEARILFKQYVNKLASVKVENNEKFLVLKRQYFTPIDGNGNPGLGLPQPTLAPYPTSSSYGTSHGTGFSSPPNYMGHPTNNPTRNELPPYGYPPPVAANNNNHLRRQNSNSQPQLYGSHISLNSNYADPYVGNQNSQPMHVGNVPLLVASQQQQQQNSSSVSVGTANFYPASHYSQSNPSLYSPPNNTHPQYQATMSQNQQYSVNPGHNINNNNSPEYPPEFGLPTLPSMTTSVPSPRRFISPQNSYGMNSSNSSNSGSPSSRAPPPYRPPPPLISQAGRFATSPTGPPPPLSSHLNPHAIMRRSSMSSSLGVPYHRTSSVPGNNAGPGSYYSTSSTQNINIPQDQSSMFQYHQRSLSVTGLPGAVNSTTTPPGEHIRYFENLTSSPVTGFIPAVPPRTKRSVERSPSAANSLSSSSSSNLNNNVGLKNRFGTRMEEDNSMIEDMQPQQRTAPGLVSGQTMQEQNRMKRDTPDTNNEMIDTEQEKENINHDQQTGDGNHSKHENRDSKSLSIQNGNLEVEQKISVKERMQKFNRIASESELSSGGNSKVSSSRNRREIASKHDSGDFDTASLSSLGYSHVQLDPKAKEWMMKAIKCDYNVLNKMAQENPALVRRKDMHTALHWAAKHGNKDCVKLLAGTFKSEVNAKSNGGYTPLHLAAQFGRQEEYDLLIKSYNADANIRDHAGKKPMQYLVRQDAALSMDTFKKLKEKRRNTEQQRERDSSFLRIGSLNVKVKSTREAFGYLLGKSTSSASIDKMHKNWGSADNIPEVEMNDKDKQIMPPPGIVSRHSHSHHGGKPSKRRSRRTADSQIIKESRSDSDSEFGFGQEWSGTSPVRE